MFALRRNVVKIWERASPTKSVWVGQPGMGARPRTPPYCLPYVEMWFKFDGVLLQLILGGACTECVSVGWKGLAGACMPYLDPLGPRDALGDVVAMLFALRRNHI